MKSNLLEAIEQTREYFHGVSNNDLSSISEEKIHGSDSLYKVIPISELIKKSKCVN